MKPFFIDLKEQANQRAKESTLSVLGISNPGLRKHLAEQFDGADPFLNGPVLEQMFGWEQSETIVSELAGSTLSSGLIDALDSDDNGRYAFKKEWKPFEHQLSSWNTLLDSNPKSAVITSGTGSGKTECFMVPVLEDLYRESQTEGALTGVRALFLYPLNALINSQRERLNAWSSHFNGDIRFCLFNRNTPDDLNAQQKQVQAKNPQEVMSRNQLRENPASILVTNGTMLEYMLVRQSDAPIIEQSKGKLRWIVLDEAHTYVGSQAAELALQLKRVLQAFEVEAKNVRFVATSATIAGEEAEEQLKQYLSDLAGVSTDQIVVIGGRRVTPKLDNPLAQDLPLYEILSIEPEGEDPVSKKAKADKEVSNKRYSALESSCLARELRTLLTKENGRPQTTDEILHALKKYKLTEAELGRWLDVCTATRKTSNGEAFLKIRAHFFQRTMQGLWSCIDTNCPDKKSTPLYGEWPFGMVYGQNRSTCTCGFPVLEVSFCQECNEPHLIGLSKPQVSSPPKLMQWTGKVNDEFSLLDEGEKEFDESRSDQHPKATRERLEVFSYLPNEETEYLPTKVSRKGIVGSSEPDSILLAQLESDAEQCRSCGFKGRGPHGKPFRRALLGAPFYTTNAIPTVLEYCPDAVKEKKDDPGPNMLPARGRRLITFTDSRQGTAKMSIKMQQEAERSKLRGLVFERLQSMIEENEAVSDELFEKVKDYSSMPLNVLEPLMPAIESASPKQAKYLQEYIEVKKSGSTVISPSVITWDELIDSLVKSRDLSESMLNENKRLAPEVFGKNTGKNDLAAMLLTREFARRPKRQNNLETQGLIQIVYPGIDQLESVPEHWLEYGLDLNDWKDYLYFCMDFFIRENTFVDINRDWKKWIGMLFSSKTLISPDSKDDEEVRVKKWPMYKKGKGVQRRIVEILIRATAINPENPSGEDLINSWLRNAWKVLVDSKNKLLTASSETSQYSLNLNNVSFSLLTSGYVCPITNKILNRAFRGFTPYLARNKSNQDLECEKIVLPDVWNIKADGEDPLTEVSIKRKLTIENTVVQGLRERNLWTDINDRAVEGGFYYTTAEHSAQQGASTLKLYEKQFKLGRKNVLNCSTTMEMGVDIGGISAVVMNNVPPHPANFLQRAGRAGRSKEARALSYTICKSNPHDLGVFNQPTWPFVTSIPAPHVEFSSAKLVQRHVNSYLLGTFLTTQIEATKSERINLQLIWFFLPEGSRDSFANEFKNWVKFLKPKYRNGIKTIVTGTALTGASSNSLIESAIKKLNEIQTRWIEDYEYLEEQLKIAEVESPYAFKLESEKHRLCSEYLLKDLATRGFLPGYGFPTDVVNLDIDNVADFIRRQEKKKNTNTREDNVSRSREMPSRNLAMAIREYAPGSEVALDGRVHRVAGISLTGVMSGLKDNQKFDLAWRCPHCGQTGYEDSANKKDQVDLFCTNEHCGKKIPSSIHLSSGDIVCQKKVLRPAGFAVDFYEEPTNNFQNQSFVPVQPAWVSASTSAITLPYRGMGTMKVDSNGSVFYHSSGHNGNGYAICLACGKAESMTSIGEFPKALTPDGIHTPPRPTKFDKGEDNKLLECSGSAKLMPGIHLGAHTATDVFELALMNPATGEHISDDEAGRIIATTLVVALRAALTKQLGISKNEINYSIRPAIVEGSKEVLVLQLFDAVSGGAGFATSAPSHIEAVLKGMVNELHCISNCNDACSKCLLEVDSRHDVDKLDRHAALDWLGENFTQYIKLDENLIGLVHGAEYCPRPLRSQMTEWLNQGVSEVKFILSENVDSWDLSLSIVKPWLYAFLERDVDVSFLLPETEFGDEVREYLYQLERIGVKHISSQYKGHVVFQAKTKKGWRSAAVQSDEPRILGSEWLETREPVVISNYEDEIVGKVISFEPVIELEKTVKIKPHKELNGRLTGFGARLVDSLCQKSPAFKALLDNQTVKSISYSDRYLKSPEVVLMLAEFVGELAINSGTNINVSTHFLDKDSKWSPTRLRNNWRWEEDFKKVAQIWIKLESKGQVDFHLHYNTHELPHFRTMIIEFESGDKAEVIFDQGFGHWSIDGRFDFDNSYEEQIKELARIKDSLKVYTRSDHPTAIYVSVLNV
ncbi:DEAD/DEAH box helicase [Reinekea thalattae]|uniref:DEAD/DEAH box helicase n=1 Tax=Reinekea thalattae TaxID=2593301 RepID=A0A5C8Z8L1_9GAMM|nr:DEAD/DEAH box helicase [Reinekea thalattae]TXR53684.1 DEAD/DEAH box helicase [Reinekea thalattae]